MKTSLAPGSKVVVDYLDRAGPLPDLAKLGFDVVPEPVRNAVAAALERWRRALGALLAEAGADMPEEEAEDRIAAVHGALVLARGTGSTAAFRRAVSRMEGLPP